MKMLVTILVSVAASMFFMNVARRLHLKRYHGVPCKCLDKIDGETDNLTVSEPETVTEVPSPQVEPPTTVEDALKRIGVNF